MHIFMYMYTCTNIYTYTFVKITRCHISFSVTSLVFFFSCRPPPRSGHTIFTHARSSCVSPLTTLMSLACSRVFASLLSLTHHRSHSASYSPYLSLSLSLYRSLYFSTYLRISPDRVCCAVCLNRHVSTQSVSFSFSLCCSASYSRSLTLSRPHSGFFLGDSCWCVSLRVPCWLRQEASAWTRVDRSE